MQIGMVGLGRMGANMSRRLLDGGHEVIGYDVDPAAVEQLVTEGALGAASLETLVEKLATPRAVWLMLPAGDVTGAAVARLAELLDRGDVVVDGGNSRHVDTVARAGLLGESGVELVDSGTSGGIWGLEEGYCLMVGSSEEAFARLEPLFRTLATEGGYARVGPPGAGHFVKMVHNGIEYALMQAYGEGFQLMHEGGYDVDVARVAELWRHGSVVRSWLLDLAARALDGDPALAELDDYVEDSGEGRWTLEYAIEHAIPAPLIALSLFERFASRQESSFSNKLVAALRREFGGHGVRSSGGQT
ncbi:MAG TPA: decarboxylating 6-phosphogluconate dehydrogenase [Actinomycetota bacterium]|nr:decarboxylating 6-phosphogluconate dehydrogenase [Actinomycetota bacterium]